MKYAQKISVIIPVYNVCNYLDECVKSICGQTYDNLQIILVDDGSTDGSGQLCDEWARKDSRVEVIHCKNQGVSCARNTGLEHAGGELIGFVDSDDCIAPDMYVQLYGRLVESGCSMVVCAYKTVDEQNNAMGQIYENIPDCTLSVDEYLSKLYENVRNHCELVIVMNRLYKKELLEHIRFAEGVIHEDEFFLNEILFQTGRVSVISNALYYYRQRTGSIVHTEFLKKNLSKYDALRKRLIKCMDYGCGEKALQAVYRNCVDIGVRFWLLATYKKLLSAEEEKSFYLDILSVMKMYRDTGVSGKQKLLWNAFRYMPNILKRVYNFHKRHKTKTM